MVQQTHIRNRIVAYLEAGQAAQRENGGKISGGDRVDIQDRKSGQTAQWGKVGYGVPAYMKLVKLYQVGNGRDIGFLRGLNPRHHYPGGLESPGC